jgi:hypothetical protein
MMALFLSKINHQIVKLMLEFLFFHKIDTLIRTIKLILLIKKLHSKGLKRSIKDVGAKKRTLFDFLIWFWHPK